MAKTNTFNQGNWCFKSTTTPILTSTEIESLSNTLGSSSIPEMIFNSKMQLKYRGKNAKGEPVNLELEFNSVDALKGALKENLYEDGKVKPVKVQYAWNKASIKDRILGESKEIEEREDLMDWTFSTNYKGTLTRNGAPLTTQPKRSLNGIDYDGLSQRNEIYFYDEVILYEDELHDAGICLLNVKLRVMEDSFFCLMRFMLRVDNVVIRLLDTRYHHVFGTNKITREFSHRENTFEELSGVSPYFLKDQDSYQDILTLVDKYNEVILLNENLKYKLKKNK